MDIGMLWFQDDPKMPLDDKIKQAADYYEQKYKVRPTECYVHPSMYEGGSRMSGGVKLHKSGTVIKNHFWLGVSDK